MQRVLFLGGFLLASPRCDDFLTHRAEAEGHPVVLPSCADAAREVAALRDRVHGLEERLRAHEALLEGALDACETEHRLRGLCEVVLEAQRGAGRRR